MRIFFIPWDALRQGADRLTYSAQRDELLVHNDEDSTRKEEMR